MKFEIESVRKNFGEKIILQDVHLHCQKGEIIALLGRNGSGKSTLLQIAAGTTKPDYCFLRIGGEVIKNQWQRYKKMAYLPQQTFLPKNIRIKNLIPLFCNSENADKLAKHSLVAPFLLSKPRELSGGELRIVEILLILFSDTDFVLLDEPFHSLSPKIVEVLKQEILAQKPHKGIIITDHNYREVLSVSDRIYLLRDGSIYPVSDVQELKFYGYLR